MPLIDDRGRLFGKVNLIDAIVALVLLGLIPLAYGAFLLFRVPAPTITALVPAKVVLHQGGTVQVTGQNFRAFLRASAGTTELPFLVQKPTVAEIKVADLPVGTYDLVLYDEGQELARKPGALTIVSPPELTEGLELRAVGAFVGFSKEEDAASIQVGAQYAPFVDVIAVRRPEPAMQRVKVADNLFVSAPLARELRVPAIIRINCAVVAGECKVGGVTVGPNATLSLPPPHKAQFLIDQVFPADAQPAFPTTATIRARFVGAPEVLNVMKPGDLDLGVSGTGADSGRAELRDVGSERQTITAFTNTEGLNRHSLQLQQPQLSFLATLRLPVVFTPSGWAYRDRPVKVGAPFTFETVHGAMVGWIVEMKVDQEKK